MVGKLTMLAMTHWAVKPQHKQIIKIFVKVQFNQGQHHLQTLFKYICIVKGQGSPQDHHLNTRGRTLTLNVYINIQA